MRGKHWWSIVHGLLCVANAYAFSSGGSYFNLFAMVLSGTMMVMNVVRKD